MKRYTLHATVTQRMDERSFHTTRQVKANMEESPKGEWVHWSDVEKLRESLENQIPEKRIEKLEKALGLVREGKCPECQQKTQNYQAPTGSFAPEAFATLRESGIDPSTGHRFGCSLSNRQTP